MEQELDLAWVQRLRDMLAERAYHHFDPAVVSIEEFVEFLQGTIFLPEWDKKFVHSVYNKYLDKVNRGGNDLTDMMSH